MNRRIALCPLTLGILLGLAGPSAALAGSYPLSPADFASLGPSPFSQPGTFSIDTSLTASHTKPTLTEPGGAFYCFPRAPKGASATEFVKRAIEHNVLVIPGNVFSEQDTHFRVSYAATDERLVAGCDILCSLV